MEGFIMPSANVHYTPFVEAALRLHRAVADYHAQDDGEKASGSTAREMARAFAEFFRIALRGAPEEVIASLVELCALETARARLDARHADAAAAPRARIIDMGARL